MKNKIKILYDGIQLQLTDSLTKVFWDERPKVMYRHCAVSVFPFSSPILLRDGGLERDGCSPSVLQR